MTPAYLATIARSVGIPEWEIEDAVQEMEIEIWRSHSQHWRAVAKYTAIDRARRHRPVLVPLDGVTVQGPEHETEVSDTLRRVLLHIPRLSPSQRKGLSWAMRRLGVRDDRMTKHASDARKRLREWCL